MSIHAVIAVRGGPAAKSRLTGRLDGSQRKALVEAMLGDMLTVLRDVQSIAKIWVVTPTPALHDLAVRAGACIIADTEGRGLNRAFTQARATITAEAPAATALLLPGDLPLLTVGDILKLVDAAADDTLVISPASRDGGTSALAFLARLPISLAFGPRSFTRHIAAAGHHGLTCRVVETPGLGLDIDRPSDLDALVRLGAGGRTATLLSDWTVAA